MFLVIALILLSILILAIWWRRRREQKERQERIQQLRTWALRHEALDPALQQWIQRLSATEAEVLLELLQGYCASLNWELSWLFAPQIKKAPVLQAALEESVSSYVRTILRSLQMEADVRAYQRYVVFEKNPTARKQRTLVDQLYTKVNEGGLTPPAKRFLGRFTRKNATPKQQVEAIQHAFERDPAQAMEFLKEALADNADIVVQQAREELAPAVLTVPAGAAA